MKFSGIISSLAIASAVSAAALPFANVGDKVVPGDAKSTLTDAAGKVVDEVTTKSGAYGVKPPTGYVPTSYVPTSYVPTSKLPTRDVATPDLPTTGALPKTDDVTDKLSTTGGDDYVPHTDIATLTVYFQQLVEDCQKKASWEDFEHHFKLLLLYISVDDLVKILAVIPGIPKDY